MCRRRRTAAGTPPATASWPLHTDAFSTITVRIIFNQMFFVLIPSPFLSENPMQHFRLLRNLWRPAVINYLLLLLSSFLFLPASNGPCFNVYHTCIIITYTCLQITLKYLPYTKSLVNTTFGSGKNSL